MSLLIGTILFVLFLIVSAWIIVEIGKRNVRKDIEKQNYDIQYTFIQSCMNMDCSKSFIDSQISQLERYPYKNEEKTEVLKVDRDKKYITAKL